jgi:hypothetical protein
MTSHDSFLREQLRTVLDRLGPKVEETPLAAYIQFTDALTAAGLSRALGQDCTKLLGLAARAGLVLFGTRGQLRLDVGELHSGRTGSQPDTSATNPTTMVQALYAALASADERSARELAQVPVEAFQSDQAPAPAIITTVAAALQAAVAGDRTAVTRLSSGAAGDEGAATYVEQLRQLRAWADRKSLDLAAVEAADRRSWRVAGRSDGDPLVLLCLPRLGLAALETS